MASTAPAPSPVQPRTGTMQQHPATGRALVLVPELLPGQANRLAPPSPAWSACAAATLTAP